MGAFFAGVHASYFRDFAEDLGAGGFEALSGGLVQVESWAFEYFRIRIFSIGQLLIRNSQYLTQTKITLFQHHRPTLFLYRNRMLRKLLTLHRPWRHLSLLLYRLNRHMTQLLKNIKLIINNYLIISFVRDILLYFLIVHWFWTLLHRM